MSPRLPAGAPHPLCVSVQPWPRAKGRGLISRGGQAICLLKHTVNISVSRGWRFLGNNSPTGHPESHRALEGTSPAGRTPPPHAAHARPARRHLPVRPSSGRVGRRVGGWRGSSHGPARAGVPVPSQAPPRGGHSCWWFLEHAWPPAPNPVRARSRLRAATTQGAAGPATRPHRGRAPAGAADPVCPGLARAACAAVCSLCGVCGRVWPCVAVCSRVWRVRRVRPCAACAAVCSRVWPCAACVACELCVACAAVSSSTGRCRTWVLVTVPALGKPGPSVGETPQHLGKALPSHGVLRLCLKGRWGRRGPGRTRALQASPSRWPGLPRRAERVGTPAPASTVAGTGRGLHFLWYLFHH